MSDPSQEDARTPRREPSLSTRSRLTSIAALLIVAGGGAALLLSQSNQPHEFPQVEIVGPDSDDEHGKSNCGEGCSLAHHPVAPFFDQDIRDAFKDYAQEPMTGGPALERLLFYGTKVRHYLAANGAGALPPAHRRFLERQLAFRQVVISFRVIDDAGHVRAATGQRHVPFGEKQHLATETQHHQHISFNGTVMRVGLYHIWARF
ncbi:MAG: hypothetical protein H6707_04955 [Deltaproteobacteria bacterium]|nr:hypothetical protein [Deltaproteobacteria bacterium]